MMRRLGYSATSILFAGALGLWSCSDSDSPTSATWVPPGIAASSAALTGEVVTAMGEALQDEYHAEAVYERVLADFGDVLPFYNVVRAEDRHSSGIARLYQNRGMAVPSSLWNVNDVARFGTIPAACAGAVEAETGNIEMYDRFLEMRLPNDVALVFTNNRRASLESHLPAFRACAGS